MSIHSPGQKLGHGFKKNANLEQSNLQPTLLQGTGACLNIKLLKFKSHDVVEFIRYVQTCSCNYKKCIYNHSCGRTIQEDIETMRKELSSLKNLLTDHDNHQSENYYNNFDKLTKQKLLGYDRRV